MVFSGGVGWGCYAGPHGTGLPVGDPAGLEHRILRHMGEDPTVSPTRVPQSPAPGTIPRRLPRDPGKRCPSLPGTRNVGRSLPQPWPALTCAGGRAALSPGPPDSEVQVWGHWTCPPGTCPLDRRCEGPQQVPSGRRGGTQLSPLCSWRRLPWTQLSLLLVTRELMEKPGSF